MQKLEIFGFQGSEALYMFSEDTQGPVGTGSSQPSV